MTIFNVYASLTFRSPLFTTTRTRSCSFQRRSNHVDLLRRGNRLLFVESYASGVLSVVAGAPWSQFGTGNPFELKKSALNNRLA